MASDLTPERRKKLRALVDEGHHLITVSRADAYALLDMAERCANVERERDCLESQCDYYKADLDAIRAMVPNVEGVATQDLVREALRALDDKEQRT